MTIITNGESGLSVLTDINAAFAALDLPDALTESYSGTGTATSGAPRLFLGGNASSGDDSAILIGRDVDGANLFSHGIRDESTFTSTGTNSSYTPFDSAATINGATAYGHTYGFQFRNNYAGTNVIDQIAAFITDPIVSGSGTATNVFGLKVNDTTGVGTVTNQYGLWISTLAKGASANFAIYVQGDNPSYFGGNMQVAGTTQLQNTVAMSYNDNLFGRGLTLQNTNSGSFAITGFQVRDSAGNNKGGIDYFSSSYANAALADTTVFGSFGSARVRIASSADESSTPDIVFAVGANTAATIVGTTRALDLETYIEMTEVSAPSAPGSNGVRFFARDNGSGKTQLCAIFATGAVQVLATEP